MNDKELLEAAAKAAGMKIHHWSTILPGPMMVDPATDDCGGYWNPIDEDGDAFRLAVNLRISPDFDERRGTVFTGYERSEKWDTPIVEKLGGDPCAATRRAIVRAAAEIGTAHG